MHPSEQLRKEIYDKITRGGDKKSVMRHRDRGKMTARDRVQYLLDDGSNFMEIGAFAAHEQYDNRVTCAGVVAGIGRVSGIYCMIVANDATIKGGTYLPMTAKKHLRAQEIADKHHLPCLYLVDSGGAFLPKQSEVFPDKDHFGRIFYNQARMSAKGIPQIAVVMGMCTAGGAYVPAMCDETIIVKGTGTIFLAGPPLVKAATGEEVSAEELGGAKLHCMESGVADHMANDDIHALSIAKDIVRSCYTHAVSSRWSHRRGRVNGRDPLRINRAQEYTNITSSSGDPGYAPQMPTHSQLFRDDTMDNNLDMEVLLSLLCDEGSIHYFKPHYGVELLCCFATMNGHKIGILANNGVLFSESALKGTHFVQLCEQRQIPLLFLQNIAGFMVGKEFEAGGIAKDGAKLVNAVSCVSVPKLTVIVGGSFGAGNYGMCGRAYDPRFLWMWPNAKISVMGPEQAAKVMMQIKQAQLEKTGKPADDKELQKLFEETKALYEHEASAFYASSRLWDDGIISPSETRHTLSMALELIKQEQMMKRMRDHQPKQDYGVFRM